MRTCKECGQSMSMNKETYTDLAEKLNQLQDVDFAELVLDRSYDGKDEAHVWLKEDEELEMTPYFLVQSRDTGKWEVREDKT